MTVRAQVVAAVLVAGAVSAPAPVVAETWRGTGEAGLEYDTNVGRIETSVDAPPVAAPMLRARVGADVRGGRARRVRWTVALGGGTRSAVTDAGASESALTGSVDASALRRSSDQLALGARATHYEVFPVDGATSARAFASSGADLSAILADDRGRTATVAVGLRRLVYKPDRDFDWTGATLTATLAQRLWRGPDDRTVDLTAGYRVERRGYRGLAYGNSCPPGAMPDIRCFGPGDRARVDLVQVASARVSYAGVRAASLTYELTVDDSTSFGSSLVRQRLIGSVTTPLPAHVFATATVTGQLDRYPEPQLVARDIANQLFTTLDDESRSSAAVRLGRGFGGGWQAELRWSLHVGALGADAASFRRQLIYAGMTWER
ncbi:MAG: hypothetical protein IPL61_08725 [Myxococcales bacterium]|nr:hypothetical protein [Myxococcales bacterium]